LQMKTNTNDEHNKFCFLPVNLVANCSLHFELAN